MLLNDVCKAKSKEYRDRATEGKQALLSLMLKTTNFIIEPNWKGWWNSRISSWDALEVEQPSKFNLCFSCIHVIDATLWRLSLFSENDTYLPTYPPTCPPISLYTKQGILVTFGVSATVPTSTMLCQSKYSFLSFWNHWRKSKSVVFCFIENNNPRHF